MPKKDKTAKVAEPRQKLRDAQPQKDVKAGSGVVVSTPKQPGDGLIRPNSQRKE